MALIFYMGTHTQVAGDVRVLRECEQPGPRQRRLKWAGAPWPPPLLPALLPQETARRRLLRAGGSLWERSLRKTPAPSEGTGPRIQSCSYPSAATPYVLSTTLSHTPPPSTAATPPPPRPLRSPSLDWSRDKSNGKRPAGTLPGDPRCDRTGPKAFPCLAGAPNPLPQPRAPLPDFRKFAKNSPHEFSCPADPRWRRIHRGGCWEQDLYPLTPAVTPVVPGFPQGGGGRWELRSRSGPGWGRVDFFPRLRE